MKNKIKIFNRGYEEVHKAVDKGGKYCKSCFTCKYFYKTREDDEDVCQNSNVVRYDIIQTNNSIYCHMWKAFHKSSKTKEVNRYDSVNQVKPRRKRVR